jgi:uncharacterized protein
MMDTACTSHGVMCRAWLCPPESEALRNERGYPALVMAHGTSGVREQLTHDIPRFTAAGMHVLLFDYRHFGASDGEPRQLLSVRRQLQDYAAALEFIRKVPGVDVERVGVWDSSLAGGHVVDVAVTDGRVAAVISQAPAMDNRARVLNVLEYAGFGQLLQLTWLGMVDIVRSAVRPNLPDAGVTSSGSQGGPIAVPHPARNLRPGCDRRPRSLRSDGTPGGQAGHCQALPDRPLRHLSGRVV